jgi:hypothetical protein
VILDNTCTAGTITLTGIGSVTDNSNGSTVVALADTPTVLHAATDALLTTVDTVVDGIQTDLDNGTDGLGALKAVVDAILVDTGTTMPATLAALNDITVADILAGIIEGTYDIQDCFKIILAYMASKASGGDTSEIIFRDTADGKDRITMTVDDNGNRTAVVVDVT